MSRNYFVNRHGKKLTVDSAVDEIAGQRITIHEMPQSVVSEPKVRRSLPKLHVSKKFAFIVVIILIVVALGSLLAVDAVKREYLSQTAAMKTSVQNLASKPSSTETSAKDAVKGVSSQLTASTSCSGNSTITSLYAPARAASDECHRVATTYSSLKASLSTMASVVTYLDAQKADLAESLAPPADGAYAVIPAQAAAWKAGYDKLVKLSPPSQLTSAHAALLKRMKVVVDAWAELATAQNAQNIANFTAAEAKLTKAYEGLRASGDDLNQVVQTVQKAIQTSVDALH